MLTQLDAFALLFLYDDYYSLALFSTLPHAILLYE